MLVWATEFPVAGGNSCGDVLDVAKETLATSPHSSWHTTSFGDTPKGDLKRLSNDGQTITLGQGELDRGHIAGLQHQWVEHGTREWTTEIVGHEIGEH